MPTRRHQKIVQRSTRQVSAFRRDEDVGGGNGHVALIDIGRLNTDGTFSRKIPGTQRVTRTPEAIVWAQFSEGTSPQVKVMVDIVETIWK